MPTYKQRKPSAASSATVRVATTKSAQYGDQPHGVYEVPEAIADAPEYNIEHKHSGDQGYGEQQHEEPHDSYEKPEYETGPEPKQGYGEPEQSGYEPAPHDEGYEAPKVAYNPAPCPKAMTADAVEDGEPPTHPLQPNRCLAVQPSCLYYAAAAAAQAGLHIASAFKAAGVTASRVYCAGVCVRSAPGQLAVTHMCAGTALRMRADPAQL